MAHHFSDIVHILSNETLRDFAAGKNRIRAAIAKAELAKRDRAVTFA